MKTGITFDAIELPRIAEAMREDISFTDEVRRTLGAEVIPRIDSRIHRFRLPNSRKQNGWYVLTQDEAGTIFGAYGDWASTEAKTINFCSKRLLTKEEIVVHDRKVKEIMEENDNYAREQLAWLIDFWPEMERASESHPYLERKKVGIHGDIRTDGKHICIPMCDKDGNLRSMQKIPGDGNKRFAEGLPTKGLRHVIHGDSRTYLCEGYATGASIHEATGATVIVCFSANNLVPVSKDYPNAVVVADNDASKTGEDYARKTGLKYILIPVEGMDANDYAVAYGLDALRKELIPEVSGSWSVPLVSWLEEPKPMSWLIKGWIPKDSVVTCFGASGSGKTFVVLDMMLSISTGQEDWFGCRVHKGNVFYMCGEGFAGMRGRAKAWAMEHGSYDLGNINITQSAKDLINMNDLQSVYDEIDSLSWRPDLIVIDTLNRFYSGDENAADKIHGFLDAIQSLQRKYSCSILIVHHTGVSQEAQTRARGSSALRAAMDVEFSVEKTEEGMLLLTQRKQKDIEFLDPVGFRLKSVDLGWTDEDGDPVKSAVIERHNGITSVNCEFPPFTQAWLLMRDGICRDGLHEKTELGWRVSSDEVVNFVTKWAKLRGEKPITSRKEVWNRIGRRGAFEKTFSPFLRRIDKDDFEVSDDPQEFSLEGPIEC